MIVQNHEFSQVSFVNGIYTKDGGVHVDAWIEEILRPIVNKINASAGSNSLNNLH